MGMVFMIYCGHYLSRGGFHKSWWQCIYPQGESFMKRAPVFLRAPIVQMFESKIIINDF